MALVCPHNLVARERERKRNERERERDKRERERKGEHTKHCISVQYTCIYI